MIRNLVLMCLLAAMAYCAAAGARADAPAARASTLVHVQRQFIPGSLAAPHAPAREVAVAPRVMPEPNA